ncbi:transient receptor potential cation channel subfamily M member 2-like [Dreissena polymorpha]|uniref:transient receptor potential cation channel subfamily M member 2-like n=1 Tax=Dreissena polymorpha TaxID=45954 RepID=UPI00226525FB|nr:transient receptor potential cation channel subfamily M member 2-like [Dreissena polymorpha]
MTCNTRESHVIIRVPAVIKTLEHAVRRESLAGCNGQSTVIVRVFRVDKAVSEHWKPHPDVSSNTTQKNRVLCFGEKNEKKGGQGSVESIESQNRFLPYWNYLYLWACMMRKHELAEILLRKVENPIAMALITYNLLKAVERQTDDKVLKTEIQKCMKKSSAVATGILNECAQRVDTKTNQILTLVIPVWQKTCIELAIESKHLEFLDQLAVRNLFGTVWNGKLEDTTTLKMATSSEKKEYFSNGWNIIDMCTIAMFFIGFGLRFKHFQDALDWPRVVLAVDFVAFFFRLIHIFSVQNVLGPKLIMIQQMFQDLVYFLVILLVFLLSYAIASHSILFPDSPVTWETFRQIIRKPYWHLYGELFLEDTEGFADCTRDVSLWTKGTFPRCPSKTGQIVVPIMMGIYMLFTNILLLNLLIAMFSHTFTVIHKRSESLWCYQRYFILKEYGIKPVICPPLNICWHIYDLVQRVCCRHATVEDPFRFENDEKRSNSARTDAVKSTNIEINYNMLKYHFPDLQKRVRTLVCKVYGDVDAIVEKTYSDTKDPEFVSRTIQMVQTLQSLCKVVSSFSNTCTNHLLEEYFKTEEYFDFAFLGLNSKTTMNTIQQQICDIETKIDVLYNLPLHVLQRNSFDKYIESKNKTQSELSDTKIKTINNRRPGFNFLSRKQVSLIGGHHIGQTGDSGISGYPHNTQ